MPTPTAPPQVHMPPTTVPQYRGPTMPPTTTQNVSPEARPYPRMSRTPTPTAEAKPRSCTFTFPAPGPGVSISPSPIASEQPTLAEEFA